MTNPAAKLRSDALLFHPTLALDDLEAARSWFETVFARESVRWKDFFDLSLLRPGYPTDYSFFVPIADLDMYAIDLARYSVGPLARNAPLFRGIEGLIGLAWFTGDIVALVERLAGYGVRCVDQSFRPVEPGRFPVGAMTEEGDIGFVLTKPSDSGIAYEFCELPERFRQSFSVKANRKLRADWTLPAPSEDDPMRIVRCSHQTVLTCRPDRADRFYREALGGTLVHTGYNAELDADSTFYRYADAVLEFAVLRPTSPIVAGDLDKHLGMTFQVADADAVERHLSAAGVNAARKDGGHHHRAGGPCVTPPVRSGFGRSLIEKSIRYQLGGESILEFWPTGIVCRMRAPLDAVIGSSPNGM